MSYMRDALGRRLDQMPVGRASHVNVKDEEYGAIGNGVADDTAAIQAALAAAPGGTVYFPPGIYAISAPLAPAPFTTLCGPGASTIYPNFTSDWQTPVPSWGLRAASIQYLPGQHGALFDGGSTCSFEGLVLRCGQGRTSADVVFASTISHFKMLHCVVQNMNNVRSDTAGSWGAAMIQGNQFSGCFNVFSGALLDCRITANTFTSMVGIGLHLATGAGLNTIAGNRFEFGNAEGIQLFTGSRQNAITGNVFDAHATYGLSCIEASEENTISGNVFWRNGRSMLGDHRDAHIYLKYSSSQIIDGNTFKKGGPDVGAAWSGPKYVVSLDTMVSSKVRFKNNGTREGCTSSSVVFDRYGNSSQCLEVDSVDIPAGPNPNESTDDLAVALIFLSKALSAPTPTYIYEDRKVTTFGSIANCQLKGVGSTAPVIANATGQLQSIGGADNINYGGLTYTTVGGRVCASGQPAVGGSNGSWPVGQLIHATTPVSSLGWVKTASGPPDVWKPFGPVDLNVGPAVGSNLWLITQARDPGERLTGTIGRNGDEATTTASFLWDDGSTGTYTSTAFNATNPGKVDGWEITYPGTPTKTVTQPTMTRNSAGSVTNRPPLTVTP